MSPRLLYFLSKTISYEDASELIQFAGKGMRGFVQHWSSMLRTRHRIAHSTFPSIIARSPHCCARSFRRARIAPHHDIGRAQCASLAASRRGKRWPVSLAGRSARQSG
jgi:hypothetical protein